MHILPHPPQKKPSSVDFQPTFFHHFSCPKNVPKNGTSFGRDAEDSARSLALELPKTRIHSELMLEAVDIVIT